MKTGVKMSDNLSENNQNQEELINKLIQEHTEGAQPSESESPSQNVLTEQEAAALGQVENIQSLIDQADEEEKPKPKTSKKFVISVNNEFVSYFEDISPEDRSKIVNNFLQKEIENKGKNRVKKRIVRIIKHVLIILLTIIIGFPLIFYIVNTSMESTLKSYKYMQVNFERLYQQKNINRL